MDLIGRRKFLGGLAAAICAPYVCRNSGLLMPIADRSLAAYSVIGHDVLGNRISETVVVPARWVRSIRVAGYKSRRYAELVEPIFQEAFRRGKLADYSPLAAGPIYPKGSSHLSFACQFVERGDEFRGINDLQNRVAITPDWNKALTI